jgi:hypothetical protein
MHCADHDDYINERLELQESDGAKLLILGVNIYHFTYNITQQEGDWKLMTMIKMEDLRKRLCKLGILIQKGGS